MLLVRRRAPEGSYFQDGDRAAGVFGVLAAGFAILLGFVIFLAFERYDAARSGSEAESLLLVQQFETAQFLPASSRERLSGELVCYARWVVHHEWPDMEAGKSDLLNPWGIALFRTIREVDPKSIPEQTAYAKWLDQTSDREVARRDRTHGAAGVIPSSLWIVMLFSAGVIFVFLLFFADPAEGAGTQAMLMGSVASVITAMLLLLGFLDNPVPRRPGQPAARGHGAHARHAPGGERRAGSERARSVHDPGARAVSERFEVLTTVLLAAATVATAWSGYQASRWNGEQAKSASRTNAIRIDAARAQGLAEAQTEVDVASFFQWVDAYVRGEGELAGFYFKRFRKEFKPAVNAWVATRPLKSRNAPLTPFAMPQYKLAATAEVKLLDAEAELSAASVRRSIQRSTNYVLCVVLFAAALFFAGISTKFGSPRVRAAALVIGTIVFLGTLVWLATFPVSLSV